jgi:hypothetical protein
MKRDVMSESQRLAKITFITNFGDFLTTFSVVKVIYDIYGDPLTAGFGSVGIGSAATVMAGFSIPFLKNRFHTKILMTSSLLICFCIVLAILSLQFGPKLNSGTIFFVLLFGQSFFSHIFDAARETHSHGFSEVDDDHQTVQATILSGFYQAQFLGPVVAFILIKYIDVVLSALERQKRRIKIRYI